MRKNVWRKYMIGVTLMSVSFGNTKKTFILYEKIEEHLETYQYSASQQTINDWVFWLQQYGVISGPYFPLLELNTGKHGPEITPYLDTFHAVNFLPKLVKIERNVNSNNYRNWTTCITRNAETHKSRNTLFL